MEFRNLFQQIFTKKPKHRDGSRWMSLTDNVANWAPWSGNAYASDLVRASVDARARHIRKLSVCFHGSGKPSLQNRLKFAPNAWTTWSQFLYRLSIVLDMQCTAFIVPVYSDTYDVVGISIAAPQQFELVDVMGKPWVRMRFAGGVVASDELRNIGVMTRFQYTNDYFGTPNDALEDTLTLIDMQKKGIKQAAKNSTTYRLMAQLSNFSNDEDIAKERDRFTEKNFSSEAEGGGFLLLPNTYSNIKELSQKTYSVDAEQQKLIQTSIYNYFGVNENILNNSATPEQLDAFYEGAIEPFAVQLAEVLTGMLYSDTEQSYGNYIEFSADRLAYMTTQAKIQMIQLLSDRGMITQNEGRAILNLPALPYGDRTTIRGEYHVEGLPGDDTDKEQSHAGMS